MGMAVLEVQQCRTFRVSAGDLLTLDVSLARLDWFSSAVYYLSFVFFFIPTERMSVGFLIYALYSTFPLRKSKSKLSFRPNN